MESFDPKSGDVVTADVPQGLSAFDVASNGEAFYALVGEGSAQASTDKSLVEWNEGGSAVRKLQRAAGSDEHILGADARSVYLQQGTQGLRVVDLHGEQVALLDKADLGDPSLRPPVAIDDRALSVARHKTGGKSTVSRFDKTTYTLTDLMQADAIYDIVVDDCALYVATPQSIERLPTR